MAVGMDFVWGIQTRVAVLTALSILSAVPRARAKILPNPGVYPGEAFYAVRLLWSGPLFQDSKATTQQATETQKSPLTDDASPSGSVPIVAYDHGQLTIVAENARLSDILSALHSVMGAEIDLPAGASDERIWARLGPGPARKVLSDLLSNTDLNYVIQGSSSDVHGIQSVMLTSRTDAGPGKPGISAGGSEAMESLRLPGISSGASETSEQEVPVSQDPAVAVDATATPPSTMASEPLPPVAGAQSSAANSIPNPSRPASMTADQIAQQLTNMYEQRKQIQQSQIGSAPN
jgi:hypothetical protein